MSSIRKPARPRIGKLREALRFYDLVARTPGLRARVAALRASGAEPGLRAIAAACGCRCSEPALQQAFRIDWQMRQRRFAGLRGPAALSRAPSALRSGRARQARSRS